MDGDIDAIVVGVGSGGTLTGVGRFMRRASPKTEMILADPVGSVLAPFVNCGEMIEAGSWTVEGIGEDFVPPNADLSLVRKAYSITDQESFAAARDVAAQGGHLRRLLVRHAADRGAALLQAADDAEAGRRPSSATPAPSISPRCSTTPSWRRRAGSTARASTRCATSSSIATPKGSAVEVRPQDTLRTVFARMRAADVSQMPVIEDDKLVGLVDESDLLAALIDGEATAAKAFETPVKDVMVTRLETISADAPIKELVPLFRKDYVAIVMDGDKFLGLVTRIDLINHFRVSL